jgi:hypothetical protein
MKEYTTTNSRLAFTPFPCKPNVFILIFNSVLEFAVFT